MKKFLDETPCLLCTKGNSRGLKKIFNKIFVKKNNKKI